MEQKDFMFAFTFNLSIRIQVLCFPYVQLVNTSTGFMFPLRSTSRFGYRFYVSLHIQLVDTSTGFVSLHVQFLDTGTRFYVSLHIQLVDTGTNVLFPITYNLSIRVQVLITE